MVRFGRLVALLATAGPALLLLALVDPSRPGHYPTCPFKALTGLDCPGCGSLRAVHDLTHGNIVGAAGHNLLLVAALPVVLLSAYRWLTRRPQQAWLSAKYAGWVTLAVVVGWAVLRNLPFASFTPLASS